MLLYYFTIILQVYCLYHAYKNRNNYYWFFIIFFIPLLGCLVYLFVNVFNKKDVEHIAEEITTIINPTKKIKDLEKELNFSNTFQNKINLADAYVEIGDYANAITFYEKALVGNFKDNPHTLNKLIFCYYQQKKFDKVLEYAAKIDLEKEFKKTNFFVGLAYEHQNKFDQAEYHLRKLDVRYSNYSERIALCNFLIRYHKKEEAKEILQEIVNEINSSTSRTRNINGVYKEALKLLNEI